MQENRLIAVYSPEIKPDSLRNAAEQLAALPGVEACAIRTGTDESPTLPATTVLWMRVLLEYSADKPQKLFRQLTQTRN